MAHGRQPRMGMEPTREKSVNKMKKIKEETEAALKTATKDMK
jgi:hypothetical protein